MQLGKLLRQMLRKEDVVGRWGGKEFVIGMPGLSKSESVERLSQALKSFRQIELKAANGTQFQATFSAGVVQLYLPHWVNLEAERRNNHFASFVASRFTLETYSASPIYVLQAGRILQQGSFEELARVEGLFAQLMARQMT
ncbi:MAG: diguanylate cyclase domain-containing protein [Microcystaceae cyanobacterium]